jgi:hypothetical protein
VGWDFPVDVCGRSAVSRTALLGLDRAVLASLIEIREELRDGADVARAIARCLDLYNAVRPLECLDFATPLSV